MGGTRVRVAYHALGQAAATRAAENTAPTEPRWLWMWLGGGGSDLGRLCSSRMETPFFSHHLAKWVDRSHGQQVAELALDASPLTFKPVIFPESPQRLSPSAAYKVRQADLSNLLARVGKTNTRNTVLIFQSCGHADMTNQLCTRGIWADWRCLPWQGREVQIG